MILLLGGSGFIGSAFRRQLERSQIQYRSVSRSTCDYTKCDQLVALIRESKASFLINAAGYTGKPNVDACEVHKADCLLGNAVLPGVVRQACELCDLPWGHVSSGCIYRGCRADGGGFIENDVPNFCFRSPPCSFYSGCKALGEECLDGADLTYIWRLRIPFDQCDGERNYLSKLQRYDRLLNATNSISHLGEFVVACLQSWQQRIEPGIYNVVNPGAVSTQEVCDLIREHLLQDKRFRFFDDEKEFMQLAASAPRSSCVLSSKKITDAGIKLTEVHDAIEFALKNWSRSR
ncbi:sugar nucleotide-binding protein [Planctomycetes bacterium K23_9]|uniref:dTDP-4-dehydrorhamnose reductase n=1 Tax=Stieleria marina TaxID=1930275 RepID=A0A517NLW9_9BACT|nr:dTDP-4-dehydrorhamnose reductase [Planctomycetes bacterium K23_9]